MNRLWRRIRAQLGFYALVVGCLATGIGATTTVFAVIDATLLRPLPYDRPSELVAFASTFRDSDFREGRFLLSPLNVMGIRDRATSIDALEAMETANLDLVSDGDPMRLLGVRTTPTLFETLGIGARAGRTLTEEDLGTSTAVITEGLWSLAFGRDPGVVGRSVELDGVGVRILGVVPDRLAYPAGTQVWLPWRPDDARPERMQSGSLQLIGRLRSGVTVDDAQAEARRVARELEALYPNHNRGRGIEVEALRAPLVRQTRPLLMALFGSSGLFLALTCANVATLMMVRMRRRAADAALRHALGASRTRLVKEALAEGAALAMVGALLGTGLAVVATPALSERVAAPLPGSPATATDLRVLVFTVLVSATSVLAFAAGPALHGVRRSFSALVSGTRGRTQSRGDRRLQAGVVAAQAGLGVLLLVAAAGAVDRFRALALVDPGFDVENTLTVRLSLLPTRWPDLSERVAFLDRVRERLSTLPSVSDVGASNILPVGDPGAMWAFSVEDLPPADENAFELARGRLVTPGYLPAVGIPVLAGRDFDVRDGMEGPPTVIVSQRLAEQYWPGQDPIGKRIKRRTYESPFPWMTVVGVVGDVRDDGPSEEIGPTLYMPYAQHENRLGFEMSVALRTEGAASVVPLVREALRELDPRMPLIRVAFMDELMDEVMAGQRSSGRLLGGFAALGLGLLAVGVFGVTVRTVQERTRELAVRVALGAAPGRVGVEVTRDVVVPLAVGALIGLALVVPALGPIEAALGGALEPPSWSLIAGPALPVAVGLLASIGPAVRAARRDPVAALRDPT